MPSMGGWEWAILALIALLLFGGSRLSGIGKNAGRAIREFKEETASLRSGAEAPETQAPTTNPAAASPTDSEPDSDTRH